MSSAFPWHTMEVDSVAHELNTDLEQGLTNKEAVSRLESSYKPNELPTLERFPWSNILIRIHLSLMIPVILLSLVLIILFYESDELLFVTENTGVIILAFLVLNIIVSGIQEFRAKNIYQKLKKQSNHSAYTKVIRNGRLTLVKTVDLVPGDVICFDTGDQIPADGRLISADNLALDESSITGMESSVEKGVKPVSTDISIQESKNMVFMGTSVSFGSGKAVVTGTGENTYIAQLITDESSYKDINQRSSMENKISRKGLRFAIGYILLFSIIWIIMLLIGKSPLKSGMLILIPAVAIWPMGLIETVTTALTTGIKRLSNNKAIVRSISNAEKLVDTTILCSDKTGIMTQDQMIVRQIFIDGRITNVEGEGYNPDSGDFASDVYDRFIDLPFLLTIASMCTNTEVKNTSEGWEVIGDSTEGALIVSALKYGLSKEELVLSLTRIEEIPFDPTRKRMSVFFDANTDGYYLFTRGTTESILQITNSIQHHGRITDLDSGKRDAILAVNQNFSKSGMKTQAFAYRKFKEKPENFNADELENDMVIVGLMGIYDPPRTDTQSAIQKCYNNLIKPIMLTDEELESALVFAKELELIQENSEFLSGEELDIMGTNEYSDIADSFSLYAGISSEQKKKIIRSLQEEKQMVAFIGKSRNDLEAITQSDVGISSQQADTNVMESSDVILIKDSFAAAVDVIECIKTTYITVKKVIRHFFYSSLSMGLVLLAYLFIVSIWKHQQVVPLSFTHVLWINFFGITIPAIAIAFEPIINYSIEYKKNVDNRIMDKTTLRHVLIRSLLIALLATAGFTITLGFSDLNANIPKAVTVIFTIFILGMLISAFECRSLSGEKFLSKYTRNKYLLVIVASVIAIQICIIYIAPLNKILGLVQLGLKDWIIVTIAVSLCFIPVENFADKIFVNKKQKDDIPDMEKDYLENEEDE